MPASDSYTPAGFDRRAMTRTQEIVWLQAFTAAMENARPAHPFYGDATPESLAEFAASKADLIVSLLPLNSIPRHADVDADPDAGISRRPCC